MNNILGTVLKENNLELNHKSSKEDNFKLKTIQELQGFTFFVEDYQRGYKWDEQQIIDLLRDLDNFEPNPQGQQFYCLQPVAIKKIDQEKLFSEVEINVEDLDNLYELVDGQQRLTTIYLILKILNPEKLNYHIEYRTRKESRNYLLRINETKHHLEEPLNFNELKGLSATLNQAWKEYVSLKKELNNVDNYHFFKAAQIVENYPYKNKDRFVNKLLDNTQIIWYNDQTKKTANQLFQNLNSGKIKLTGSELIKALFILEIEKQDDLPNISYFKQNEFALEWDEIEYKLHDPHFWSFIKGRKGKKYSNRIGYLFDVLSNGVGEKDEYFAYRKYAEKGKPLNWEEVKDLFNQLEEWFNDNYLYHRIGFLLNQNFPGFDSLEKILKLRNQSIEYKSRFRWSLDLAIRKIFRTPDKKNRSYPYHIDAIDFSENKNIALDVLVLFNIISYERILPDYKINFQKFYNSTWTIEHIHPQNPESLTPAEAVQFLEEFKSRISTSTDKFEDATIVEKKILEFQKQLKGKNEKQSKKIIKSIKIFTDDLTSSMDLHGIGNLTLLRQSENSQLNNSLFREKRDKVIAMAESVNHKESFLPIVTLNVFNKYYTRNEDLRMTYWYREDAEAYKREIRKSLSKYLPK